MGHYTCPNCGGHEVYQGNVVVQRKGVTLTNEIGDSGIYGSRSYGGGSDTAKVVKCKVCREILSEDNYAPSQAENNQALIKDLGWFLMILCILAGVFAKPLVVFIGDVFFKDGD